MTISQRGTVDGSEGPVPCDVVWRGERWLAGGVLER
jgi:hypothetical protein